MSPNGISQSMEDEQLCIPGALEPGSHERADGGVESEEAREARGLIYFPSVEESHGRQSTQIPLFPIVATPKDDGTSNPQGGGEGEAVPVVQHDEASVDVCGTNEGGQACCNVPCLFCVPFDLAGGSRSGPTRGERALVHTERFRLQRLKRGSR